MKSIIMLGGGIQQVPAVKRLKNIGYQVIVTDMNPNAPAFEGADVCVNLGATDIKSLISWVLVNKERFNIAGIFTLTNYAATVAIVANATGLPSLPVDTVIRCDNKLLMKRAFLQHGFKSAEFYEVQSIEEATNAFDKIDGNAYLKVVDGFGGKGVCKITCPRDISDVFESLKNESLYPTLILEEEIVGDYIDTQGIFSDGQFFPAGDADSFFSNSLPEYKNFNPVEIFNVCPSQLSSDTVAAAYTMLKEIAIALNMNFGPVGGDFVVNENGIFVIEIGPRLHGPNGTLQMFPKAMNVKPLEFMAQVLCGDHPNTDFVDIQRNAVALCNVFISNKPEINDVGFDTDPLSMEGIFTSYIYKSKNKPLKQSEMKLAGLASAFVVGKDLNEAQHRLTQLKQHFYIH